MAAVLISSTVEKVSERRGYWNPSYFPTVAAFAALPKPEQDQVVIICKRSGGINGMAVEAIPVVALQR